MVGKILIFTLLTAQISWGQTNTVACGGDLSGTGGSLSYSVGQIDYYTISNTAGVVSEGVQQPFELFSIDVSSVFVYTNGFNAILYPNPSIGVVHLKIAEFSLENLTYKLYNLQGKLIQSSKLNAAFTTIDISHIEEGSYYLSIQNESQILKNFKLIKQ